MKTHRILAVLALAFVVLAGTAIAAETLVSGPQIDQKVPGPFHPLNVTGANAGEKFCLFCANGQNPVAMVFARETSPGLAKLVKKLDTCTAKNSGCSMGSFVVFLSDEEGLADKLKTMAKDEGLKNIVLAIDNPAGPQAYKVSKEADVTVVLYTDRVVKANYAFKKGEIKDTDIEKIVGDISKITPSK
jgi:hypothetical protein